MPEFSRTERVDTIGDQARDVTIAADAVERSALAHRFGVVAIDRLDARFAVRREGGIILATGHVAAAVTQACAATGVPLATTIEEPVALRFVDAVDTAEDLELVADALDTLPIEAGAIDLGEAAAETMALALDPFARAPDADAALAAAGVVGEDEIRSGAFGALADLRRKLTGDM